MRVTPRNGSDYGKSTAQLALILVSLVVLGFFMVAIVLKFHGYPSTNHVRWKALPLFLREHGWHLLWIPLVWTFLAVYAQRRERGELYQNVYWLGLSAAFLMIIAFFVAALDPYTRPIFVRMKKPQAPAPQVMTADPKAVRTPSTSPAEPHARN